MKPLNGSYDAKISEKKWQQQWEQSGVYAWKNDLPRAQTYVIDTPPPTVSGHLHMGHIFSYTQTDFVARYKRMSGMDVFYPMGFDDNGLPTERLVEKTKKIQAHRYIAEHGREGFIAQCQSVVDEALKEFRGLFTSVALSVDWAQQYDTISPEVLKLSQESFIDMMNNSHVERRLQPMLWDPVDQTAIAQAEVEEKEQASHMNHITFFVDEDKKANGSREEVIIATTRPELLAACVAVFYHPEDARYQKLKGKHAITPLFGVKVPFLADEMVQQEKGTGLVMCCTFGDETDIGWWRGHKLTTRMILNKYGKICNLEHVGKTHPDTGEAWPSVQAAPRLAQFAEMLNGKKATDARMLMIAQLQEYQLLIKQDPITHAVKCAERSGATLELLPTHQWFVKVLDKKEELKARNNECNWYPDFMRIRMEQWIDGLKWDWCISRQRYFGVPFPVWYSKRAGEEGKIILAHIDDLPVNPLKDLPRGYSRDEVDADPDVMDTWATSSISPQISAKGLKGGERFAKLFPADLRPQAHEIIRTWAFYTLVKAHLHSSSVPWKDLMISGWCLASDKSKMSKSKGNVVTPTTLIEQHSADAVRFWASTSRLGADTAFSEEALKIGRKLVNKLWNASNLTAITISKKEIAPTTAAKDIASGKITEPLDLWILSRLHHTIAKATEEFEAYEYCDARVTIEEFFWKDFCDNYLELVKARAYGENNMSGQESALLALHHCLHTVLKLFAPFVPHVTEEIYNQLFAEGSIHARGNWPKITDFSANAEAEAAGILTVQALSAIRKLKAEKNVSIKYPLEKITIALPDSANKAVFAKSLPDLLSAGNANAAELAAPEFSDVADSEDGSIKISGVLAAQAGAA